MDSFLTKWINDKSNNLSIKLHKKFKNLKPDVFTTSCLVINAFALMNLLYNEYFSFLVLFILAYYCNYMAKFYGEKFNLMDKIRNYYYNLATYVQFISLYLIFAKFYKYKINLGYYLVLFVSLTLLSLNYFIKEYNIEKIHSLDLGEVKHYTKYFDENMTFVYILIIVTMLYYKNNLKKILKIKRH
tara:strand:+ start:204 stop:761 length:558 start_codon:yes stop_codon:yes gene_type:complete